jgi:hypothetical protein
MADLVFAANSVAIGSLRVLLKNCIPLAGGSRFECAIFLR